MNEIDRRTALRVLTYGLAQLGFLGASGCVSHAPRSGAPKTGKGTVFFCLPRTDDTSTLRIVNWDDFSHTDYVLPLGNPHSLVQDSRSPRTVYVFETLGSSAKVDLDTGKFVKIDHRTSKEFFSGHGAQSQHGDRLFTTQYVDTRAVVAIRDATTLEQIALAPRECDDCHQIIALPGSSVIACGNLKKSPTAPGGAVTFFDYEAKKVVGRVEFDDPILHLVAVSPTEVLSVSRPQSLRDAQLISISHSKSSLENSANYNSQVIPRSGPVCYANLDGKRRVAWDESRPELFKGGFGIANLPKQSGFVSGHTDSSSLILWKNFEIQHVVSAPEPANIVVSWDETEIMVLTKAGVKIYSTETLSELRSLAFPRLPVVIGGFRNAYA